MSKEKIIKIREPGPEFQALASDWKPTKRRAWLVQPVAANPLLSESANAKPAIAERAYAELAYPKPADADSALAKVENADQAHAERAIANSALAEKADAESAARSLQADAPSALADPASANRANAGTANAPSADSKTAGAPPAIAKSASTSSANAGSAKVKGAYAGSAPPGIDLAAGGWTKVQNKLLDALVRSDLSPRAVRMMLLFVRQTSGYHRRFVELSNTELAATSGIHISHISATVRELVDRGYLGKTTGGGRSKSRYCVCDAETAYAASANPADALSADAAPSRIGDGSTRRISEDPSTEIANADAHFGAGGEGLKKSLFKENLQRNSLKDAPAAWYRYTATLTEKTRERADLIFEGLKQRFPEDSAEELAACPENLREHGAPDGKTWAEIKSPHGLMDAAWPQLRDFFRAKALAKSCTAQTSAERARQAEETDRELRVEVETVQEAFALAFPDEQSRADALQRFKPAWISNCLTEPGRSVAIDAWFRSTTEAAS